MPLILITPATTLTVPLDDAKEALVTGPINEMGEGCKDLSDFVREVANMDIVEITPEMVAAGIEEFHEFHFGQREHEIVAAIYLAMELQRRSSG